MKKGQITPPSSELTDLQFRILHSAVTLAKNEDIRSLASLRLRLLKLYPGKPKNIAKALKFWANYLVKTRSHCEQ